jgi:hypothetical protein
MRKGGLYCKLPFNSSRGNGGKVTSQAFQQAERRAIQLSSYMGPSYVLTRHKGEHRIAISGLILIEIMHLLHECGRLIGLSQLVR